MNRMTCITLRWITALLLTAVGGSASGGTLPLISGVDWQPLKAQARRLIQATDYLGSPFSGEDKRALERALGSHEGGGETAALQRVLDAYCLYGVNISPEMRVKVVQGPARPVLMQNGWRQFLVKVENQAGATAALEATSPNALRLPNAPPGEIEERWLEIKMSNSQPLTKTLSGLEVEYRIIQLYSRDAGKRDARVGFHVGQGTQDIGFRNEVDILFSCEPANAITLNVLDEHGKPTTGAFVFRDSLGRVYPSQAKRLAPDFAFHPQVYRADGGSIRLPNGVYTVEFSRGPESIKQTRAIQVDPATKSLRFQVKRWIDPSEYGWWSGDHHIHAAGCAHYTNPTLGVLPADMMRQCLGEDLKVGATLTWGPCFDYQKQFFTGADNKVSVFPYLLHYDVEVSGFGSHRSGHLCLLRLRQQIYPGGDSKDHWPTLCLNTLRWAKRQGALVGPAHSGWGLQQSTEELPTYEVPPFNGIGANEYIVDVTHQVPGPQGKMVPAVDFMSAVDTPYVWELNIWYHTLNVGYRTRISGETDFPCIYGERVGLGRSYVHLGRDLSYFAWCEGIRAGRNYVSDGHSHLMGFEVNGVSMGEADSEVHLARPSTVKLSVRAAAWLNEEPNLEIKRRPYTKKPYWNLERARLGTGRKVPVEIVMNAYPVARREIIADGRLNTLDFEIPIEKSSWLAVRILPSSHTNPLFVLVGRKPIRASKRSAEWCLASVDQCWKSKERFIAEDEMGEAKAAYAHARETYRRLIQESE